MKFRTLAIAVFAALSPMTATAYADDHANSPDQAMREHMARMLQRATPSLTGGGSEAPQLELDGLESESVTAEDTHDVPQDTIHQSDNEQQTQPIILPQKQDIEVDQKQLKTVSTDLPSQKAFLAEAETIASINTDEHKVTHKDTPMIIEPITDESSTKIATDLPAAPALDPNTDEAEQTPALLSGTPSDLESEQKPSALVRLLLAIFPKVESDSYDEYRHIAAPSTAEEGNGEAMRPIIKTPDSASYDDPELANQRKAEIQIKAADMIETKPPKASFIANQLVDEIDETFTIPRDSLINEVLQDWAKEAGWILDWKINTTWRVPAETTYSGTFEGVLQEVITSLYNEGKPVRLILWENRFAEVVDVSTR